MPEYKLDVSVARFFEPSCWRAEDGESCKSSEGEGERGGVSRGRRESGGLIMWSGGSGLRDVGPY